MTITGDETGYQVAVNGSESAHAGELSQLAETARQAVRDACLRAAGLSPRQLEALTASTGEEDSHEEGFWVQYGYSILAMILCLMLSLIHISPRGRPSRMARAVDSTVT